MEMFGNLLTAVTDTVSNNIPTHFNDTKNYCEKKNLPSARSTKYEHNQPHFCDEILLMNVKKMEPAKIVVENMNTFEMAIKVLHDDESRPLVLNLASYENAGGAYNNDLVQSQEESLFRTSNYYKTFDETVYPVVKKFYPLKMDEVIYTPLVYIVKDSSYKLLGDHYPVACVAVSAIQNPRVIVYDNRLMYVSNNDEKIMQEKIDMIFKMGILHGHKVLVLGALGCGVYRNPVYQVVEMFKKSIEKYGCYFKKICFAILCTKNTTNFDVFKKVLLP